VNKEYQKIIKEMGGEQIFLDFIKDLYNWEMDDFKEMSLKPYLLEKRLQERIGSDPFINKTAFQKIKDAQREIREGRRFEEVAQEYNEDPFIQKDGDMGFIKRGTFPEEFEKVVFLLKEGEISKVFKTPDGYNIVKLEEKKINSRTGEEEIHLKRIFVKTKDLKTIVDEEIERAKIFILLKKS